MGRAKRPKAIPSVALVSGAFDGKRALEAVRRPDCGAVVVYLGTVRSSPHGGGTKRVVRLEYEAFETMALKKLAAVRAQAMKRFDVRAFILHHRLGKFKVGEEVVMCAACAPHREEAVGAVRWAIAEMKQTVPIWKKEVYAGGGQKWVVGEMRVKEVVARPKARRRKA